MVGTADDIERRLRSWGATRIDTHRAGGDVSIDFHTPFPGDQPIRSGIQLTDGEVTEATIRYGVLEEGSYPTHPTRNNGAIHRLRNAVMGDDMPHEGHVLVNYGDTHRKPRPHILYGWTPESDVLDVSEAEYLQRAGIREPTDPEAFLDWVIRAGGDIEQEFRGEWVSETGDDELRSLGLRDLAPDSVLEDR